MASTPDGEKRLVSSCPSCGKRFRTQADRRGKRVRCPACREPFVIGGDSRTAIPARPRRPKRQDQQAQSQTSTRWATRTVFAGLTSAAAVLALVAFLCFRQAGTPSSEVKEISASEHAAPQDAWKPVAVHPVAPESPSTPDVAVSSPPTSPPTQIPNSAPALSRSVTPVFTGPERLSEIDLSALPTFQATSDKDTFTIQFERAKKKLEYFRAYLEARRLTGHIVVGRVELDDGSDASLVQMQGSIFGPDNCFAFVAEDLKQPIGFRMHQFEPVDLLLTGCSGAVIDVGTIRMRKLAIDELRPLTGRIVLKGWEAASTAIVHLQPDMGPINSPRKNNSGARGSTASYPVPADGVLDLRDFSPIPYRGGVMAQGYVAQVINPDFRSAEGVELGTITLERQQTIQLDYVTLPAEDVSKPFSLSSVRTAKIGGGELFTLEGHPNRLFDLLQNDGSLSFACNRSVSRFRDLGVGQLDDLVNVSKTADDYRSNGPVTHGHVYLFEVIYLKKCHVLLRVTAGQSGGNSVAEQNAASLESQASNHTTPRSITPRFKGPASIEELEISALPTFATAADKKEFTRWFESQESRLRAWKDKDGYIVVGKVELGDGFGPSRVASQDLILKDGTFAHLTRDLQRPFGLRAHGFEPVDIQLTGCQGRVVDVGTIRLEKLPPSSLRSLKGQIALEGSTDASSTTIELSITTGPENLLAGSRRSSGERVTVNVSADGAVSARGFSPARYYASVRAPGHIEQFIELDFRTAPGAVIDRVTLEKAITVQCEFMSIQDDQGSPLLNESTVQQAAWRGGEQWESLVGQNRIRIKLDQDDGKLRLRSLASITRIKDLGPGRLAHFLKMKHTPDGMKSFVPVEAGHVYLIRTRDANTYLLHVKTIAAD